MNVSSRADASDETQVARLRIASAALRRASRPVGSIRASSKPPRAFSRFVGRPGLPAFVASSSASAFGCVVRTSDAAVK
jgi:hypothetical protein